MTKRYKYLAIFFLILVLVLTIVLVVRCSKSTPNLPSQPTQTSTTLQNPTQTTSTTMQILTPPQSPVNLTAKAESFDIVFLQWIDNSPNEDGFVIYRDDTQIVKLGANASNYQDTNLKPNTTYQYAVKAYNQAGESGTSTYTIKTPNPPILVRLEKIGVFDNREDIVRGEDGEVYLYLVVTDGKDTAQRLRFPHTAGQYYKLAKNETIDINTVLFSTKEVGDYLSITAIGYEDDGGGFEPLVYKAIGLAIESQLGIAGGILEVFDLNLDNLVGQFFGQTDDWLGSYEHTWYSNNNWGIGSYTDVVCTDERGVKCLRLWFSVITK